MNRHMVSTFGLAVALLLAASDSVAGQGGARVEYRSGRIGVEVAVGDFHLPAGHGAVRRGWILADWGPLRIRVASRRPAWAARTLHRQELRHLLGRKTVKRIEWHARRLGVRGPTHGRWLRADRRTMVLEVTVGRIPVAFLRDYGPDGFIDELLLIRPHPPTRPGARRFDGFQGWDGRYGGRPGYRDDRDDDWDDWDDDWYQTRDGHKYEDQRRRGGIPDR